MNVDIEDIEIIDNVSADTIEIGDQIVVEGDYIEVKDISDSADIDEVIISGYSHISGDRVTYSLYADDYYDVWSL